MSLLLLFGQQNQQVLPTPPSAIMPPSQIRTTRRAYSNDDYTSGIYQVVEGASDPIDVQLLNNGYPFDATGMAIAVILATADGSPPPAVNGKVSWSDASRSIMKYHPAVNDLLFLHSPYTIRFVVTDGAGDIYIYPRFLHPDQILVGQ